MKSWKDSNLLNRLKLKENTENSFEYTVCISGGYIRIARRLEDGDYKYTNKTYITESEGRAVDRAIRQDSDVARGNGLAEYVDDIYRDNISSILYDGIKEGEIRPGANSYSFKPVLKFKVTGTIPEEVPLEGFKEYITDYIEGQCSDGWGEGFEQQPLPSKPRKDRFGYDVPVKQWKYFSPWSGESEVWIRER